MFFYELRLLQIASGSAFWLADDYFHLCNPKDLCLKLIETRVQANNDERLCSLAVLSIHSEGVNEPDLDKAIGN